MNIYGYAIDESYTSLSITVNKHETGSLASDSLLVHLYLVVKAIDSVDTSFLFVVTYCPNALF